MSRESLAPPSQSAGQLAAELGVRAATLLGQEFALAKAELRATARTTLLPLTTESLREDLRATRE